MLELLSAQYCFGLNATQGYGRDAAQHDAHVFDAIVINFRHACKTNFGDRLRLACADLAVVLMERFIAAAHTDPREQLVRLNDHLFVAGVKSVIRHPTRASC